MGFVESVKTCLKKYVTFSGRASRSEFWWFMLFGFILSIVFTLPMGGVTEVNLTDQGTMNLKSISITAILFQIISLILSIPFYAVTFRRIHDINRSGWWVGGPILISSLISSLMLILVLIGATSPLSMHKNDLFISFFVIGMLLYSILMFVWFCTKGTEGPNKYGPDPLA